MKKKQLLGGRSSFIPAFWGLHIRVKWNIWVGKEQGDGYIGRWKWIHCWDEEQVSLYTVEVFAEESNVLDEK